MKKPVPQTQAKPGTAAAKLKKAKFSPEMQAKWNDFARPMLEAIADEKKKTALVDPTGKHKVLSSIVAGLLFGKPCEEDRAWMGEFILKGIEESSPDELQKEFDAIVAMKRKAIAARAGEGHKNARYANLLARFKKITGRMPFSLVEFWGYVKEKKVEFPKNRTRINKQIGIAHLPQRHRKKE
jgi:hypothetical protein